jgi:hypothetical protein
VAARALGHFVAGALVAFLYGLYTFFLNQGYLVMGLTRYLAYQSSHFDSIAARTPLFDAVVAGVFIGVLLGVFELLASAFTRLIERARRPKPQTPARDGRLDID